MTSSPWKPRSPNPPTRTCTHPALRNSWGQGLLSPGKQPTAWAPHLQRAGTLEKSMDVPWMAVTQSCSQASHFIPCSWTWMLVTPTSASQLGYAKAVAAPQSPSSHMGTQQWFCRGVFTAALWQPHLPSSGKSCPARVSKGTALSLLALGSGFQWWLYCKESRGLKCTCHLSTCNYIL